MDKFELTLVLCEIVSVNKAKLYLIHQTAD